MNDKELHCLANVIMILLIAFIFNLGLAIGIAFFISIVKEIWDKYIRKSYFSIGDLVADIIGITIGCLIYLLAR